MTEPEKRNPYFLENAPESHDPSRKSRKNRRKGGVQRVAAA
jgi:hypothetical protein